METKGVPKKHKGNRLPEPALNPYQMVRLRECMKNSARLKELGLPDHYYNRVVAEDAAIHFNKNQSEGVHSDKYQTGGSESEYDPLLDNSGEGDLVDDENAKQCSKEKTRKNTSNQTSSKHPGGVRFQSRKRVFADLSTPRVTRSKKSIAQQDANLTPSDFYVPPPSQANESHTRDLVGNLDDHTQAAVEGDTSALRNSTHMTTGADVTDWPNQHNQKDDGGDTQRDDNTLVADVTDGITQLGDHNQITDEGREERRDRGHNMGRGLYRLNRAHRGRLQVVITEGNIRPVVPLVAAKYASECNIIVRNHVPILPHWKLYKIKPATAFVGLFMQKLQAKFDINIEDETIKKACHAMMKSAVRQQRYKLKQEYFDPFPLHLVTKTSPLKCMSNEQWIQLVESWKSPKKMRHVKRTNATERMLSSIIQLNPVPIWFMLKIWETNTMRKNLIHLICSRNAIIARKKCYAPAVQDAITQLENKLSTIGEGERLKSVAGVVDDVLAQNTKNNKFLNNVGFQNVQPTSGQQMEVELEAEKRANAELRVQVADLSKKVQESEEARMIDREEMKRTQSKMSAKIDLLLSQVRRS